MKEEKKKEETIKVALEQDCLKFVFYWQKKKKKEGRKEGIKKERKKFVTNEYNALLASRNISVHFHMYSRFSVHISVSR